MSCCSGMIARTMARLIFLVALCGTIGVVVAYMGVDECINKSVCNCDDQQRVECVCDSRNTTIIVWPFTIRKHHSSIRLKNCGLVQFMSLSMSTFPPTSLELIGNVRVILDHSVFHSLKTTDHLVFENTSINEINSFAFHDVSGLKHLTFRRVTIGTIASHAFISLHGVQSISIMNCDIGFISQKAFVNITDVNFFQIVDTYVHDFGPEALVVRDVKQFELQNCTIDKWGNHSLTLINASSITIKNNRVGKLGDRGLTTMLGGNLMLTGNEIEFAANDAFAGLKDASNITISENRFLNVEVVSLLTIFPNSLLNNSVPCNENMCFLFDYGDDLQTLQARTPSLDLNWCLENGRLLSEYYSRMDDEDTCKLGVSSGDGNTQATLDTAGMASDGVINQARSGNAASSIQLSAAVVFLILSSMSCIRLW